MAQKPLSGKKALVTGAGRGIGYYIALALADAGADVAVTARSRDEIEKAAEDVRARGVQSWAQPCDVTDTGQISALAEFVGAVDILVNNAGFGRSHKFLDHPDDLWQQMLDVNLTSVYYVTKAFAPGMVEKEWGRIINIASDSSKVGAPYIAAYTAAKHGVLGLTRSLALEFMQHNITVNAVCPGYVDTPMTDGTIERIVQRTGKTPQEARAYLEAMSPQNRLMESEEVAALTVYLAGDIAKGITGQGINVDGGGVMF